MGKIQRDWILLVVNSGIIFSRITIMIGKNDAKEIIMEFQLKLLFVTLVGITLLSLPMTGSAENPIPSFENPAIYIVCSVSDDKAQITARGGSEEGIKIVGIIHDRRLYYNAIYKNRVNIGQTDFQFDTVEPSLYDLMRACPECKCNFFGQTIDENEFLSSGVTLSCDLLDPPDFILYDGYENIPMDNFVISFTTLEKADAIRLEIEDEEESVAMSFEAVSIE
jgi:hypothetical protein